MDSEIAKRDVAIALAEEEERCLAREIQEMEKSEMPDVDTDGDQVKNACHRLLLFFRVEYIFDSKRWFYIVILHLFGKLKKKVLKTLKVNVISLIKSVTKEAS